MMNSYIVYYIETNRQNVTKNGNDPLYREKNEF